MEGSQLSFINVGRGVYTLAEASRLTKVNRYRISRWTRGYTFSHHGKRQSMPPLIGRAPGSLESPILTFSDLIEIRFLDAFRQHGVSTRALRIASERAKELLGRHHPFSTQIFKSDGRTILAEITKDTHRRQSSSRHCQRATRFREGNFGISVRRVRFQ
jgi:hypothetical protein